MVKALVLALVGTFWKGTNGSRRSCTLMTSSPKGSPPNATLVGV